MLRICLAGSHVVNPGGVEKCRVVSSDVARHPPRKMLAGSRVVSRRVGFMATGRWLGARKVAGLAVVCMLAIWIRHREDPELALASYRDVEREQVGHARGRGPDGREPRLASSKRGGRGQVKSCREAVSSGHPPLTSDCEAGG